MMRHIYIIKGIVMATALVALASCVKDDLYDMPGPGPEPGHEGRLKIVANFDGKSSEAVIPPVTRLCIDGYDVHSETQTAQFDVELSAGSHDLLVYSLADGFSYNGNIASVNVARADDAAGAATRAGGAVEAQPEYLFAAAQQAEVNKHGEQTVTMPMRQLVRRLDFNLYDAGDGGSGIYVQSVRATLSGVATSVDMVTGELSGDAATVSGTFDASGKRHYLFFRILGVASAARQMLTLDVTWSNGETQTIESDLTDIIEDKKEIQIFDSEITPPVEAGAGGELSPWVPGGEGGGDAI